MENNNRILNEITAWNDKVNNLKGVFGKHVTGLPVYHSGKVGTL